MSARAPTETVTRVFGVPWPPSKMGPMALMAENPELGDERLSDPRGQLQKTIEAVVYALGVRVLEAPDPPALRPHRNG